MAVLIWILIVLLVGFWLLGFFLVHLAGPLIHLLLLVALVLLIWNLLFAPRGQL